jgi:uncharacterized protein YbaR (Trm112 family)
VLSKDLLDMLACPDDRTPLHLADEELVARLNQAVEEKRLTNKAGSLVAQQLDGALVREDGAIIYPIIDGIPVLLVDEGIPADQVEESQPPK